MLRKYSGLDSYWANRKQFIEAFEGTLHKLTVEKHICKKMKEKQNGHLSQFRIH